MSYFILVDMFSNNSDNNKFEDANNVEHDFYRIMLVECVVVVPLTKYQKKIILVEVLPIENIKVCDGCFEQFRMEKHAFMN